MNACSKAFLFALCSRGRDCGALRGGMLAPSDDWHLMAISSDGHRSHTVRVINPAREDIYIYSHISERVRETGHPPRGISRDRVRDESCKAVWGLDQLNLRLNLDHARSVGMIRNVLKQSLPSSKLMGPFLHILIRRSKVFSFNFVIRGPGSGTTRNWRFQVMKLLYPLAVTEE